MKNIPIAALIGLFFTALYFLMAIFAPLIAPYGMAEIVGDVWEPSSSEFLLGTDSIGGPTVRRSHPAVVGDEASITARPRVVTGSGMGIAILVNDRQQAFTFMRPNSEASLDSTIELRITVPALDRFGDPK